MNFSTDCRLTAIKEIQIEMKLLILGGTKFLGRHVVEQALAAGHVVTLFNRDKTNPGLFAGEVEKVIGDRDTDLHQLSDRHFDACIDPSGYLPQQLEISGRVLKDVADRYVFISSISVYPRFVENLDESGELEVLADDVDRTVYNDQYYGAFKVLCEQAIEAAMPGRVLHVRSGLIVGPYDPTNRFTYWLERVSRGGQVLAPESPGFPVQMIHAADQARWLLKILESDRMGVYNVTSDNGTYTLGEIIDTAKRLTGSDAQPAWVSSEFLLAQEVRPWMGLPLWLPEAQLNMSKVSARKAVDTGMTLMPLEDIIQSTIDWFRDEPEREWPAGMPEDQEQRLLETWREQEQR